MRVAFFSDVHSNLPALEAVLADTAAVGDGGLPTIEPGIDNWKDALILGI